MKKRTFYLVIILHLCIHGYSQDTTYIKQGLDSTINLKTRLNFSVPDFPAFKALGNDPSNILRPSSAKDLALMFTNFANSSGSFLIPQNFALEVTPALLVKPNYTLKAYQDKFGIQLLSKTAISIGTNKDVKTNVNSVAFGIRSTIIDKGDFRLNKSILSKIYDKQDKLTNLLFQNSSNARIILGKSIPEWDQMEIGIRNRLIDSIHKKSQKSILDNFDKEFKEELEAFKKSNWNATKLDFAYSLLTQSPDSLLGNIKVNKHLFWLTLALKPGKNNTWGQILLGVNNSILTANDKMYNDFSFNTRFYGGGNLFKGFFEAQYRKNESPSINSSQRETLYLQLGIEANLYKGAWIHFGTGVSNALTGNSKSQIMSNLNLFLTLPEDFKFF